MSARQKPGIGRSWFAADRDPFVTRLVESGYRQRQRRIHAGSVSGGDPASFADQTYRGQHHGASSPSRSRPSCASTGVALTHPLTLPAPACLCPVPSEPAAAKSATAAASAVDFAVHPGGPERGRAIGSPPEDPAIRTPTRSAPGGAMPGTTRASCRHPSALTGVASLFVGLPSRAVGGAAGGSSRPSKRATVSTQGPVLASFLLSSRRPAASTGGAVGSREATLLHSAPAQPLVFPPEPTVLSTARPEPRPAPSPPPMLDLPLFSSTPTTPNAAPLPHTPPQRLVVSAQARPPRLRRPSQRRAVGRSSCAWHGQTGGAGGRRRAGSSAGRARRAWCSG